MNAVRLSIADGKAMVDDQDVERVPLPAGLRIALREWARIAAAVLPDADERAAALVARRGRQLAGQLAAVAGASVSYLDPTTGRPELVDLAARPAAADNRHELTPWGTGLTVTAIAAFVVTLIDLTLTSGLAETSVWLAIPVNAFIAAGLAPSLYLSRSTRTWRWLAAGVVIGLPISWILLLFTLL